MPVHTRSAQRIIEVMAHDGGFGPEEAVQLFNSKSSIILNRISEGVGETGAVGENIICKHGQSADKLEFIDQDLVIVYPEPYDTGAVLKEYTWDKWVPGPSPKLPFEQESQASP